MNLNSDAWRDLVFEGKNKEYGAYYLRKTSSKRHIYALLIITICIISVLILSLYILRKSGETSDDELKPVNLSELSMVEYQFENLESPKIEEKNKEEKIKNTPPKIVTDEEEVPELVDQPEIKSIPADSTALTPEDSISLADSQSKLPEITDELETYVLNPSDSTQKSSSLQAAILRHVYYNLQYPDAAYKQKIKGKVIYSFVVNKDGSISDISLVKGIYAFLDDEVLRVIHSMPILEPEKRDGKPIRVKFYLPVVFS